MCPYKTNTFFYLSQASRRWLEKLPPALKKQCAPEPCHLFWPPWTPAEARTEAVRRLFSEGNHPPPAELDCESEWESADRDGDGESTQGEKPEKREKPKSRRRKNMTSFAQVSILCASAPAYLEGVFASAMPGLMYVTSVFAAVICGNFVSLVYLALVVLLMEGDTFFGKTARRGVRKPPSTPRRRRRAWRFAVGACALIVVWQYAVSMGVPPTSLDFSPPPPPPAPPPAPPPSPPPSPPPPHPPPPSPSPRPGRPPRPPMAPRSPPPPPHPPPPYVEMHVVTRRLLDVPKDVSSGTNAKSTESKVSSQTRVSQTVATRVARFFGMTKVSSTLLGLHFLVFFIAACSFRADACLIDAEDSAMRCAALDGELAPSFNAFEDEDEDETEDEEQFLLRRGNRDENRLYLLLPRRTPTQRATLPGKTSQSRNFGNDDDDDDDVNSNSSNTSDDDCSLFAPLTWSHSENFTSLEWFRYFVFRYALEVALIFVFAAGASSRDLTHLGYLLLTLTFLRIRDLVMVKGDNLWRWLRWYNLFAIASACAWTLWLGTSDLMRGTGIDTSDQTAYSTGGCSAARVVGVSNTAGSLLPDLLIFVVARVTQVVIASETHKAVVLMEREARALGRANAETGKQKWLAGALSRRVRLAREREERRRRAEDVRAHVEQLSKEVLDLENNAAPVEPMSPVHKHATYDAHDNARSYASESSFVSAGEENKDAKETEISEEDKLDAKPGPENPSTRQTSPENPNKGPVTTYGERLLHTLRGEVADPSSTLGLVIGGLTTITPWLAAPNSSACYFFFFAAFAFDFSAATLLYPTSLTLYALLAPRKPSLKFWSSMLMYSEGVLLTGFLLAIPCASGCFASRNCLSSSSSAGVVVNGANWVNAPVFFAYLATLFHRSALLRNGEMDDTFRALERSGDGVHGRSAENGRGARDGNSRTGNEDGTTSGIDSPTEDTFVDKIQAFVAAAEAFFQKVITETSERDPSFVAVAVTTIDKGEPFSSSDETGNGNDGVSWEEVAVALNVVLHEHYRSVGTSRSADATDTACAKNPPFLKLVESDPHTRKQFARSFLADENENPAAKTPRKAAIFAVTAPAQALTPAADIARVLQAAQLRNCLRDDDVVRNEPNKGTYWGFFKSRLPVRPDYARLFAHTSHESHAPTLADSRLTLFFPKSQFRNRSPTSWP